ncbi:MAG: ABC transporter ATP-binding protein/permease [Lachnospiraceae bacterium]|nr:ABC transporter ATP-binding protein/permease [Lachnospiraceae bacterium]MCM1238335.1 ABC transporter ATP-binding protein/permease [Lachnospiraceae bacterium]
MKEKMLFIIGRIKAGRLQEMWIQTKWIYQYVRKYWLVMIFYTFLGMVSTVVSLLSSLISRDLVDIITGHQTGMVIQTFCIMIGLGVGNTFLSQVSGYASSYLSMKVDAEIKSDIFSKILVTDWESLTNYHTGDLLTRWGSDASTISTGVLSFIPNMIIYVFRFISSFAMVVYHDASFAVFAFLGMPVSLILSRTLMNRMVNNNKKSAAMGAKMSGFNQETFSNIQTIKAFDLIHLYVEKLKSYQKEYIGMRLSFQRMSMGTSLLLSTVGMMVSYAAYGWGIYRVWSGAISYGSMTMFLSLSGTLTGTLHNLTSLIPSAISLTTSAGRLMDIVEMPREDYSQNDEVNVFLDKYRNQGIGLQVSDMDYGYMTGTQVFSHASLEAYPHEIVALVGPSGEGKTTLIRLILSLMRTQGGLAVVCGGGKEGEAGTEKIPLTPSTRRLFSYVPQGNTMFSGTIAENMRNVKQDATDEEIIEALKLACAWDFVEKLPNGIDSEIKERGGGFSEGQAQRLSIARAILRKSPLLLLDEATSALDVATERKVLRNIMQDSYPRTCIVTTHRPTVLEACTRVYAIRDKKCVVLDDAEIEEMVRGF